jgi:3-methyladenine DNA glycosylase Tag
MSKVIFRVGFNRAVVDQKWPAIREAFNGFSIDAVASYSAGDLARLLEDPRVIRNGRKIEAVVRNARTFQDIRAEFGSFRRMLNSMTPAGEASLCKSLSERFAYLGGSSALFFLRAVGVEMPETMRRLQR